MVRGTIQFKCDDCGEIFLAPDIEYRATVLSCPVECPKCKSMHTLPNTFFGSMQKGVYKKIWAENEKRKKE